MRRAHGTGSNHGLDQSLARGGFKFTAQREHVYAVLLQETDHPTAEQVFVRAKRDRPEISRTTVYSCLDALVKCGLARQVTLARGAARFCQNMKPHSHFYCDTCDNVFDVEAWVEGELGLPEGFEAERCEIAIHGRCPKCVGETRRET
jgi:Fe2+ or Zn2+ uptake regulation protein